MLDSWIGFAEGFLLVYAIDDIESFNEISVKYKRIIKNKSKDKPCVVIVGNKCDLDKSGKRKIETKEGEELAKSLGVHFMEVSAFEKINVKEGFLILAKELLCKKGKLDNPLKDEEKSKKKCYCF
jgi:GTPase SAR1 family protein